jgi:signal transduction histidine kinase
VARLPAWLDPSVPSSVPAGLATTLLTITTVTLLIFPLGRILDAGALDALYIPVVLFLAAKWGPTMGVIAALLGALAFTYFHGHRVHTFHDLPSTAVAFLAVVVGAMYVHTMTLRTRSAEERRRQEVTARRRVLATADEERRRVVRDLHDGAQQHLVSAGLHLKMALDELPETDPNTRELVEKGRTSLNQANAELRELAQGILPPLLTRGGLLTAVRALVSGLPLPVMIDIPDVRFDPAIEATAYFVISEALTNVVKHAHADRAEVTAAASSRQLRVVVSDNGIGGAHIEGSNGLIGLEDRVSAMAGKLIVRSPTGEGTRITMLLALTD